MKSACYEAPKIADWPTALLCRDQKSMTYVNQPLNRGHKKASNSLASLVLQFRAKSLIPRIYMLIRSQVPDLPHKNPVLY